LEFTRFLEIAKSLGPDFQGLPRESLARLHRDYLRTREGWGLDKDVLQAMSEVPSDKPNTKPLISPVADPRSWTYKRKPLGKLIVRKPKFPSASAPELNSISMTSSISYEQPVVVRMDRTNPTIHSAACILHGKRVMVKIRKAQGILMANILDAISMEEHNLEINALDVPHTALGFSWDKWLGDHVGYKGQGGYYIQNGAATTLQNAAR
jgi:hypothetical protein